MSKVYPVIPAARARTRVNQERYQEMYSQSVEDNAGFWSEQARRINWIKPFSKVRDVSWDRKDVYIRWFEDGTLNASYNCLDRHIEKRGDQTAIIWEGDDPKSRGAVGRAFRPAVGPSVRPRARRGSVSLEAR